MNSFPWCLLTHAAHALIPMLKYPTGPSLRPIPLAALAAATLCAFTGVANAQGADTCAQAQQINLGPSNVGSIPWTTVGATDDASPTCATYETATQRIADVWFRYTAPAAGVLTIRDTTDSGTLALYSACGGTQIACSNGNYDSGPPATINVFPVTANTTYILAVQSLFPDTRTAALDISFSPNGVPANDTCATATAAILGSNNFSNLFATTDSAASCRASQNDIWYTFTAPSAGPYRFRTTYNFAGFAFGVLTAFSDCGQSELACNSYPLPIDVGLVQGQTIRVRVASTPSDGLGLGAGALTIEPTPTPPNDICAGALPVSTGTTNVNSSNTFYNSGPAPCLATGTDYADVWYSFTAPSTGTTRLTIGPDFSQFPFVYSWNITVYAACNGSVLACASANSNNAQLCGFPVVQGTTYLIRLASLGANGAQGGRGLLNITPPVATPPTNITCAAPQQLANGNTTFNLDATCAGELWYRYTNTTQTLRNIRVRTCGSSTPNTLFVYHQCDDAFFTSNSSGGCTAGQNGSTVRFCLQPGESALVLLSGPGTGTLNVSSVVPAANDLCENASPLNAGNNTVNTTLGCGDADVPCADRNGTYIPPYSREVWYRFVPPQSGYARLELTPGTNTGAPLGLTVRQGCNGSIINCADGNRRSEVCVPVLAGVEYIVGVSNTYNDSGLGGFLDFGPSTLRLTYTPTQFLPPDDALPEPEDCVEWLFGYCSGDDGGIAGLAEGQSYVGTTASWNLLTGYNGDNFDGFWFDLDEPGIVRFTGQIEYAGYLYIYNNGALDECLREEIFYRELNNSCINNFDTGEIYIPVAGRHEVVLQVDYTNFRACVDDETGFWIRRECIDCGPTCSDIDFNNDGSFFDPADIQAFLSVFSEGPCFPSQNVCDGIDFNNDGSLFDPCDIDSFLLAFSEGPCTPCGL